jgi:uncharacterized protein
MSVAGFGVDGLLLFPGAGSGRDHSSLLKIEEAVAPLPVVRADFPYRKLGRRAPDRAPVLLDCVRAEAAAMGGSRLVLGGRSMGGRMCSMAVAGGEEIGVAIPAAGLVLISYPLHPPGKPEKLRVEHLPRITVPCLFIHGTRDTFGSPEELQEWTATIPGEVTHVWMDRKGHDLKACDAEIAAAIVTWLPTIG